MNQSEEIKDLAAALSKAQGLIEDAKKDSENPHYKSKYADLSSIWEACRKPLTENNLSVAQFTEGGPEVVTIVTRLLHSSGQWLESSLSIKSTKPDAQGLGSAITYGRRYALAAMVGIAPAEDDGNGACGKKDIPESEQEKTETAAGIPNALNTEFEDFVTQKAMENDLIVGSVFEGIGYTGERLTIAKRAQFTRAVKDYCNEHGRKMA